MKNFTKYIALIIALFTVQPLSAQIQWSKPTVMAMGGKSYNITITASLDDGWKMYDMVEREGGAYATSLTVSESNEYKAIGNPKIQQDATLKYDEMFQMEIGYYTHDITFSQEVEIYQRSTKVDVTIENMLCNATSCTPPSEYNFSVVVGEAQNQAATDIIDVGFTHPQTKSHNSLWGIIIEAILWGFAALLTPCVFPMVPMTISFFMKGEEGSLSRGRVAALLYGLFIVLLYTLPIAAVIFITRILGGDAVTADIFNWVATHWLPNILFFVIFMLFAASFFGAFEITLPSSWVNRSDSHANKHSIAGIFFLALTLVLVSFSCTGPIVGSVLIKSTAGEFTQPIITMFAFSAAFALPFVIVALFPALIQRLPKSGGWLSSVKIVLGFIELALGLKFLSVADQVYHWGLLNREVYLAIWIVIFSLLGLYLLGKIEFKHDTKVSSIGITRLMLSIATFSFVLYLIPGMWGAPLKPLAGYLPPLESQEFVMGDGAVATAYNEVKYSEIFKKPFPNNLPVFYNFEEAQEYARKVNKPLFVDFTGHSCVNCREMEQRVWSDERVDAILREEYVIVALYMDDRHELPKSEWVTTESGRVLKTIGRINSHFASERFGINSQPTYLILNNDGKPLSPPRGYDLNITGYIEFLQNGLRKYSGAITSPQSTTTVYPHIPLHGNPQ